MSGFALHGDVISSFRNLNMNAMKTEIEKNKGGIEISPLTFVNEDGFTAFAEMSVKNVGLTSRNLVEISIMNSCEGVFVLAESYSGVIQPNETKVISLSCDPPCPGIYRGVICFQFEGFGIGRYAKFNYGDEDLNSALRPSSKYVKKRRQRRTPRSHIVTSNALDVSTGLKPYCRSLASSNKTKESITAFETSVKHYTTFLQNLVKDFQTYETQHGSVNMKLYSRLYSGLLNIEELQLGDDIRMFDLSNVYLRKKSSTLLALTVDGLAEKRPSVLVGDIIFAHLSDDKTDCKYEGKVERIEEKEVFLKFHSKFHAQHTNAAHYDVQFTINRRTWKSLLQGVRLSAEPVREAFMSSFLFPVSATHANDEANDELLSTTTAKHPPLMVGSFSISSNSQAPSDAASVMDMLSSTLSSLTFTDSELNAQQQSAVKNILSGGGNKVKAPYIIFGPPGTGKTVTIVKTIEHYFSIPANHDKHILICAPSNTATDLLVTRLHDQFPSKNDMFRLMSYMRNKSEVSEIVEQHCEPDFQVPKLEALIKYPIIVSTCMMSGKLYNHGLPEGHFDAVFVDESGHSWEPEVLSTFVSSLNRQTGQLIIAGDPKQLGPITHNTVAAECGLGLSLLERLIARPLYSRDVTRHPETNGYDPQYITKLVNCYRCHPEIIRLPNALFYNNDLVPMAHPSISHNLCAWSGLPRRDFPLIFHGIEGECLQESTSPSWFNINEVEIVLSYVKKLLASTTERVTASEIGIITPYARQVKKIKHALQLSKIYDCTVGSCEQLQGQERRVVIISTVRSSSDYSSYDIKYNLGFVSSPKRFNVAVTRAQALLIVVGSPKMLRSDPNWNDLLEHCVNNGAYVGVPLTQSTGASEETAQRYLSLLNNMRRDPDAPTSGNDGDDDGDAAQGLDEDYEMVDFEE